MRVGERTLKGERPFNCRRYELNGKLKSSRCLGQEENLQSSRMLRLAAVVLSLLI